MLSRLRNERGNWTLISLLVAVAIIGVLFYVFLAPQLGSKNSRAVKEGLVQPKENQTIVGASLDKGRETQCMSNLRQIRMLVDSAKNSDEGLPASLEDMKLGSISTCPVSGKPYQYDAATGTVKCTSPGHERL